VAHVRLCHSRMLFVRAYPRECGIRGKAATDSDARRPLIPTEAGQ
jgi:hypothetical protein